MFKQIDKIYIHIIYYFNMRRPLIFDTTLRDGEQMPSVVFRPEEKIELAKKFSEFGVDFIDIMPMVSEGEKYVAKRLAKEKLDAEISAITRLRKCDIDTVLECDVPRVLLFTSLSDIQREYKMRISREENLEKSLEMIDYAHDHGLKVDFGGEDTSRLYLEDPEYLAFFVKQISNKIEHLFPADTIGCLFPHETYEFVKYLKGSCNCSIVLHQHNDLGLATANTLEGLRAGADAFSGTFTGIGERAGNAPIEEVCIALKTKGINLDVKYGMLTEVCRLVERYSGVHPQKHKPIIGENAFSHKSGIHTNGTTKEPKTYEVISPESVGQKRRYLFDKLSGSSGLKYVLRSYNPSDGEINSLLKEIKRQSELGKKTFSEGEVAEMYEAHFKLIKVHT
jgi:isopropylmalate/homocitrate/citramalate synthase